MTSLFPRRYATILIHILLWVLFGFTLLLYMPLNWGFALPPEFWIKQGIVLTMIISVYYLNAYMLVPRLLLKNKIAWFIGVLAVIVLSCQVFLREAEVLLRLYPLMDEGIRPPVPYPRPHRSGYLFDPFLTMMILLVAGISTSVTSTQKWQSEDKKRQLLEQDKIRSELAFLKAQINPHFFFNTLNNIYALTHTDVETSRTSLHKLSRLMRYVLYDTEQERTALSKEIAFIHDYIELMKLRISKQVTVTVNTSGAAQHDPQIAPMLLLPFIENAFKHGISSVYRSQIDISLSTERDMMFLQVSNMVFQDQSESPENGHGIGLANTRRRLNLLYPGKHMLLIEQDRNNIPNLFKVHLQLKTD